MTIDEYAALEAAHGVRVVHVDGIWWRRVRPFFYRPLFPFQEILPGSKQPPRGARLGGFQHLVPTAEMSNSRRQLVVWDNMPDYSMDILRGNRRNAVKKGVKCFSVTEVTDPEEFISAGHDVYCSFFERTGYEYKKERLNRKHFAEWARTLYRFPKVKILGAYHGAELSAIDISYVVEDVLIEATSFSKTEYMKYQVADLIAHVLRERMAPCTNIRCLYEGAATGIRGIDNSKTMRGSKIIPKPAFYHVNPLARLALRTLMKQTFNKLLGSVDDAGPDFRRP